MTASSGWRDGVASNDDSVTYAKRRHYASIEPSAPPISGFDFCGRQEFLPYSTSHSTPSKWRTKSAPYAEDGVWYPALKLPFRTRTPTATKVFAVNP